MGDHTTDHSISLLLHRNFSGSHILICIESYYIKMQLDVHNLFDDRGNVLGYIVVPGNPTACTIQHAKD